MIEFLTQHGPLLGYCIVLLGSLVEGESVILTAGFLSFKGFFSLPALIAISFFGSLFADQFLFQVGRFYGPSIIERSPKIKRRAQKVFNYLHRHETVFILSFRFIYGIRVASPIIIGASGTSVRRFTSLNFIAAFIWAVISCSAGYLLGYFFSDSIEGFLKQSDAYQRYAAGGAIGLFLIIAAYYYWRSKRQK